MQILAFTSRLLSLTHTETRLSHEKSPGWFFWLPPASLLATARYSCRAGCQEEETDFCVDVYNAMLTENSIHDTY